MTVRSSPARATALLKDFEMRSIASVVPGAVTTNRPSDWRFQRLRCGTSRSGIGQGGFFFFVWRSPDGARNISRRSRSKCPPSGCGVQAIDRIAPERVPVLNPTRMNLARCRLETSRFRVAKWSGVHGAWRCRSMARGLGQSRRPGYGRLHRELTTVHVVRPLAVA